MDCLWCFLCRSAGVFGILLAIALAPAAAESLDGPVPARVLAVIDGDTIAVSAHIWLGQDIEVRVRLAGVDAPELKGGCALERDLAHRARAFVAARLDGGPVRLTEIRVDKYGGRVVARVATAGGEDLAGALMAAGLARPYDGRKRRAWCERAAAPHFETSPITDK